MEIIAEDLNLKHFTNYAKEPEEEITAFFDCFRLHEAKEELNKLKYAEMDDDTLYFIEKLDKLMEATWLMR